MVDMLLKHVVVVCNVVFLHQCFMPHQSLLG